MRIGGCPKFFWATPQSSFHWDVPWNRPTSELGLPPEWQNGNPQGLFCLGKREMKNLWSPKGSTWCPGFPWGCPWPWGSPRWMGYNGKCHGKIGMMTGGSPMTKRKPTYISRAGSHTHTCVCVYPICKRTIFSVGQSGWRPAKKTVLSI